MLKKSKKEEKQETSESQQNVNKPQFIGIDYSLSNTSTYSNTLTYIPGTYTYTLPTYTISPATYTVPAIYTIGTSSTISPANIINYTYSYNSWTGVFYYTLPKREILFCA